MEVPGGGSEGYHVLKILENSPAHHAGLEAYFDFVISIDGVRLNQENDLLKQILQKYIDQPVKVGVYNSKSRSIRDVTLVPSNTWGGQGLLGVSIRFCSFSGAAENVWHVLEVHPNSPAALAGLVPHSDYILGSDTMMSTDDDFYTLIENNDHKQLRLYVYNSEMDSCREVLLTPNSEWGGEGSLGCGIGYGYLHRIPVGRKQQTPPDPELGGPERAQGVAPPLPAAATSTPSEGFADVPLSVPSQPGSPHVATVTESLSTIEAGVEALSVQPVSQEPLTHTPILPDTLTPAPFTVIRSPSPVKQQSEPTNQALIEIDQAPPTYSTPTRAQGYVTMATSDHQAVPPITTDSSAVSAGKLFMGDPNHVSATLTSALPGASQSLPPLPATALPQATPSISAPLMTGALPQLGAPLSGLPTSPPTISLPAIPPTISLGPSPLPLTPGNTTTAQ